ncbi:hypothetical protein DERP_001121 [Dermatophagoides pteronyssinus]|uniref:Uncharacterized protein n=1 Tax=Dermatophagoides pteronyssinus TaxID=6956 RepID=A0ABQ8JE32_DERPT|nr:hypothetical protein DERP_001121 [Dermatophagoides pteronyssinus]
MDVPLFELLFEPMATACGQCDADRCHEGENFLLFANELPTVEQLMNDKMNNQDEDNDKIDVQTVQTKGATTQSDDKIYKILTIHE